MITICPRIPIHHLRDIFLIKLGVFLMRPHRRFGSKLKLRGVLLLSLFQLSPICHTSHVLYTHVYTHITVIQFPAHSVSRRLCQSAVAG